MTWKEIGRDEWSSFLDGFRDQHQAWLVSVSLSNGEPSRFRPLRDVRYVREVGGEPKIIVAVGHRAHPTEIEVGDPRVLCVDESLEGASCGLVVEGAEGRMVLRFLSAVPPEMVDGRMGP